MRIATSAKKMYAKHFSCQMLAFENPDVDTQAYGSLESDLGTCMKTERLAQSKASNQNGVQKSTTNL